MPWRTWKRLVKKVLVNLSSYCKRLTVWRPVIGRDTFMALAPVLGPSQKNWLCRPLPRFMAVSSIPECDIKVVTACAICSRPKLGWHAWTRSYIFFLYAPWRKHSRPRRKHSRLLPTKYVAKQYKEAQAAAQCRQSRNKTAYVSSFVQTRRPPPTGWWFEGPSQVWRGRVKWHCLIVSPPRVSMFCADSLQSVTRD